MKVYGIQQLINQRRYEAAVQLWKEAMREASVFDPRRDETWGPITDEIAQALLADEGWTRYNEYWLELLKFMQEEIEPQWGTLHKGHFLMRLGFGHLATEEQKAGSFFAEAGEATRKLMEEYRSERRLRVPVEEVLGKSASYMMRFILPLIEEGDFRTPEERRRFYAGLASVKWDVLWGPKLIDAHLVRRSLHELLADEDRHEALIVYDHLQSVFLQGVPSVVVAQVRFLAEVLLCRLLLRRSFQREVLRRSCLRELVQAALDSELFPSDKIATTFYSVLLFGDKLYRLPAANPSYDEAVFASLASGMKITLEEAIVDWADLLHEAGRR